MCTGTASETNLRNFAGVNVFIRCWCGVWAITANARYITLTPNRKLPELCLRLSFDDARCSASLFDHSTVEFPQFSSSSTTLKSPVSRYINLMEQSSDEEYEAFKEKVKRTIYLDNLSNQVTKAVLETALDQFGTVTNVQFIPTYFNSCTIYAALVEMESIKQAEEIVNEMSDSPFMISGMPRPVRAQKAKIEMFDDRPKKRRKQIVCYWMDPSHPNFEVAKKMKNLTKKHAVEASFLMEKQMEDEEKLHKQQEVNLKANYKKYELIDAAQADGTFNRLASRYAAK
ncbi:hypothetical protein L1887_10495 [Cichorium endivia]|nr:hypothetical protein L1887_10495 [Cichorium endivia]